MGTRGRGLRMGMGAQGWENSLPLAVTPRSPRTPGPGGVYHARPTAPDPPARRPTPSPRPAGSPARARDRTHRGGGLPGGRHDGGQRSRHVIAAHTPAPAAARRKRKAERAPGRAQERASGESGPPTGARSGACAPPGPAPRSGPAPPFGPVRPCRPSRRCLRVTMSRRVAPGWLRPRAARVDLRARAAHAPCGRRAWRAGARGHCRPRASGLRPAKVGTWGSFRGVSFRGRSTVYFGGPLPSSSKLQLERETVVTGFPPFTSGRMWS